MGRRKGVLPIRESEAEQCKVITQIRVHKIGKNSVIEGLDLI